MSFSKKAPTDLTDERLETIAKDIETTHTKAVLHIAAQLAEARDIFCYRRDEGGFGGWVETRLRYSRSTAYNLLSIHERFGGEKDLSKCLDTFHASILYRLAAPSTPKEACDQIIERAQAGETVPVAEVKRVIKDAKGRKRPPKRRSTTTKPIKPKLSDADAVGSAWNALKPSYQRIAQRLRKQFSETPGEVQLYFLELMRELMSDDINPASTGEIARKDAEIEELRNAKRQLEISISEVQTAIEKWKETVETQRGIIARLENENASLRAGVAAPPDDDLDIPASLRRAPR